MSNNAPVQRYENAANPEDVLRYPPKYALVPNYVPAPKYAPARRYEPTSNNAPAPRYEPTSNNAPIPSYEPTSNNAPAQRYAPTSNNVPDPRSGSNNAPVPSYVPAQRYAPTSNNVPVPRSGSNNAPVPRSGSNYDIDNAPAPNFVATNPVPMYAPAPRSGSNNAPDSNYSLDNVPAPNFVATNPDPDFVATNPVSRYDLNIDDNKNSDINITLNSGPITSFLGTTMIGSLGIIFFVIGIAAFFLGLTNSIILRKHYEDKIELNTEDNHWLNVANANIACIIINIISTFLIMFCAFNIDIPICNFLIKPFDYIRMITGIMYLILSFASSVKLIDLYKSDSNNQYKVILSAIYITLASISILHRFYRFVENRNKNKTENETENENKTE
jgi:hypothetical protein